MSIPDIPVCVYVGVWQGDISPLRPLRISLLCQRQKLDSSSSSSSSQIHTHRRKFTLVNTTQPPCADLSVICPRNETLTVHVRVCDCKCGDPHEDYLFMGLLFPYRTLIFSFISFGGLSCFINPLIQTGLTVLDHAHYVYLQSSVKQTGSEDDLISHGRLRHAAVMTHTGEKEEQKQPQFQGVHILTLCQPV